EGGVGALDPAEGYCLVRRTSWDLQRQIRVREIKDLLPAELVQQVIDLSPGVNGLQYDPCWGGRMPTHIPEANDQSRLSFPFMRERRLSVPQLALLGELERVFPYGEHTLEMATMFEKALPARYREWAVTGCDA